MICELSTTEMEFVSRGHFYENPIPGAVGGTVGQLQSQILASMGILPWGADGDEVVSTSTREGGFFSRLKKAVRDLGHAAFDILDLNHDGDLWEETAGALGLLGIGLATGGTGWVALVGASAAGGGIILGGFAAWEDSLPNS